MPNIDYCGADDVDLRTREDEAHQRYIKAVRHTGRTEGFMIGFVCALVMAMFFL